MGKFKGILKSLAGGLLLTTAFLPGVAGIGGLVGAGISGVVGLSYDPMTEYEESAIYRQEYLNDADAASQQHLNGELSDEEYYEKLQYFGSDDHKYEIVQRDIEENKPYQVSIKKRDVCYDWAKGLAIAGAVGAGLSLIWYIGPVAEKAADEADWQFTSARNDFDEERRKEEEAERLRKEQEYNRKREEELKRQFEIDKPFMESEEEEDLPDIEDTYYRD